MGNFGPVTSRVTLNLHHCPAKAGSTLPPTLSMNPKPSPTSIPPSADWIVLTVQSPEPGQEILLAEALRRLGARALEREGSRVLAYLPHPRDLPSFLRRARAVIRSSTTVSDPWLEWRRADPEELSSSWARGLQVRLVGRYFALVPWGTTRHPVKLQELGDRVPLKMHPAPAFGAGQHPTTRGCLRLLERMVRAGDHLVDVGTGSGVLAIAAALLGAASVRAFEADAPSAAAAAENARLNQVSDRVEVIRKRIGVTGTSTQPNERFGPRAPDGIMANLDPALLVDLVPELSAGLAPDGWLLLSGLPQSEAASVMEAAVSQRLQVVDEDLEAGWTTVCLRRRGERRPG